MHLTKIFKYTPTAALEVSGDDAFDYLQSQFSNDLRELNSTKKAVWGFFLNRKGHFVGDAFILKSSNNCFKIFSYKTPASVLKSKIEENIVADDVSCKIEENWHAATIWGNIPDQIHAQYLFPGRQLKQSHLEIFSQSPINLQGILVSEKDLTDQRILDGIGIPYVDLLPGNFPQECNMHDGVSLFKGCFLGQEVMSRINSIGQVRKNLYILQGHNLSEDLYLDGKLIAHITSATQDKTAALAIIKNDIAPSLPHKIPNLSSIKQVSAS